ncbi:MAG: homoserine kinase [Rikenellaceae bacterium]|jgi:homoserine kinase|nr:homoserine kinase [Rikenellaceae bacterium]
MKKTIKVFAPATVANLGSGFDVMGMAIDGTGDELEVAVEEGEGLEIINKSAVELPSDIEKNVVTPAVRALLAAYGRAVKVTVTVLHKILPGSGIGSSAASSAGAVYGLNELLDRPFGERALVEFAMEGESLIGGGARHADNVGPAIMGGVVLIRGYEPLDIVKLPVPDDFYTVVVHPHITVTTKEGRGVLPREIPLHTAITQWGNVGGLVAGLALGDMGLVGRSIQDAVAEPARKHFIPGYDELKEALLAGGALAVNIAGSGPAVFAVCDTMTRAEQLGRLMTAHFAHLGIDADVYPSKISGIGTRVID